MEDWGGLLGPWQELVTPGMEFRWPGMTLSLRDVRDGVRMPDREMSLGGIWRGLEGVEESWWDLDWVPGGAKEGLRGSEACEGFGCLGCRSGVKEILEGKRLTWNWIIEVREMQGHGHGQQICFSVVTCDASELAAIIKLRLLWDWLKACHAIWLTICFKQLRRLKLQDHFSSLGLSPKTSFILASYLLEFWLFTF